MVSGILVFGILVFGACSFRLGKEEIPGPDGFRDRKAVDDHQKDQTLTQRPHRSHLDSQCPALFSFMDKWEVSLFDG